MNFASETFLIFATIFFATYWVMPDARSQNVLTLGASWLFYAWWDWRFLSLIVGSTLFNFWVAPLVRDKRQWLWIAVAGNLGLLCIFKYFGFFTTEMIRALSSIGISTQLQTLEIILPVGISFFTFQALSYVLDLRAGKVDEEQSLLRFACFIALFPQLVAGPIVRASRLLPQLQRRHVFSWPFFWLGLERIVVGLFLKLTIADRLAPFVDRAFASPEMFGSTALAAGVFLFAVQIYTDFAAYSLIAIGLAFLMGLRLRRNFNHPYLACSFSDFWKRWHISLSTWLRDYLYIPLGGNRRHRDRNLMATMLLGGLWHGAGWGFLFWGALHGSYLALFRRLRPMRLPIWATRVGVFLAVCLAWVFFRAETFSDAMVIFKGLARLDIEPPVGLGGTVQLVLAMSLATGVLFSDWLHENRKAAPVLATRGARQIKAVLAVCLVAFLGVGEGGAFVYFQF